MASHKSAKKRIRITERRRKINKISVSKIKTSLKKVFDSKKKEDAEKYYKEAVANLDRGVSKSRLHGNTAARKKSQLTKYINSLTK
jgi:small subunit ribosomal protein S20